jgi:hypothetical protein
MLRRFLVKIFLKTIIMAHLVPVYIKTSDFNNNFRFPDPGLSPGALCSPENPDSQLDDSKEGKNTKNSKRQRRQRTHFTSQQLQVAASGGCL